jgi:hypothetical protein
MNSIKKTTIFVVLFSFSSLFGLGITVVNDYPRNPYNAPAPGSPESKDQRAYYEWHAFQERERTPICVHFGKSSSEKCTSINPGKSSTFYLGLNKLYVSIPPHNTHAQDAIVFDLDSAKKQHGNIDIETIFVKAGTNGIEGITIRTKQGKEVDLKGKRNLDRSQVIID